METIVMMDAAKMVRSWLIFERMETTAVAPKINVAALVALFHPSKNLRLRR